MHQVDMPINWHFLRLSIIKQRQFLSPWEKQIRKFFEENKRKKWRIIEHYLAGLLDSPSMRRHYRRVCNSGRREQLRTANNDSAFNLIGRPLQGGPESSNPNAPNI